VRGFGDKFELAPLIFLRKQIAQRHRREPTLRAEREPLERDDDEPELFDRDEEPDRDDDERDDEPELFDRDEEPELFERDDEPELFVSPDFERCLLTVRAAISLARSGERPCSSSLSVMCSYWRSRFALHAFGIACSPFGRCRGSYCRSPRFLRAAMPARAAGSGYLRRTRR
jgi:hypothetical protein